MKHYTSIKAICPFYKHENRNVIFCEGIKDGTVLHLAFANPTDCIEHKKRYCRCNYKGCSINSMLNSKYDRT